MSVYIHRVAGVQVDRQGQIDASTRSPQCSEVRAALHTQNQTLHDCATFLRRHVLAWWLATQSVIRASKERRRPMRRVEPGRVTGFLDHLLHDTHKSSNVACTITFG